MKAAEAVAAADVSASTPVETPKSVAPKPPAATGGSPLDRIRAQGAAKKE